MKKIYLVILALIMTSCGYSARNNEMIGQVKKVIKNTPMICDDFNAADISLGVIRGGVGSMSSQDVEVTVNDAESLKALMEANASGLLVKITYDEKRFSWCRPIIIVTKVEPVQ